MRFRSMLRVLFPTGAVLLCGATATNADAYTYWHTICGQAGIMKHPATEAASWTNSYCGMTQSSGKTLELDFPLAIDEGNVDLTGYLQAYASATSWDSASGQLISLNDDGSYSSMSSGSALGLSPYSQEISLGTVFVNPGGYAFIAAFAGTGSTIYGVHWMQ